MLLPAHALAFKPQNVSAWGLISLVRVIAELHLQLAGSSGGNTLSPPLPCRVHKSIRLLKVAAQKHGFERVSVGQ